jgi:hypothetical protein
MQRYWWLLLVVALMVAAGAQPELADGGEPASGSKNGTLTGTGAGLFQVTMLVGNLVVEGEGDLLISSRARFEVEGEKGAQETVDQAQVAKFLGKPTTAKAAKPPARSSYLIYRGFKGKLTLMDNRFMLALRGTVTSILAYGLGTAVLVGEGTWATAVEGIEGKHEGAWQAKPAETTEPANAKAAKTVPTSVAIGQFKPAKKALPKPKRKAAEPAA